MLDDVIFKKEYCKGKIKSLEIKKASKGKKEQCIKSVFDSCVIDIAPMERLKYHHNKINF
jgi:hypothetical protein